MADGYLRLENASFWRDSGSVVDNFNWTSTLRYSSEIVGDRDSRHGEEDSDSEIASTDQ